MYAYKGLQCWKSRLLAPLEPADTTVMIGALDLGTIGALLQNGSHTYLVISAPGLGCEVVRASFAYGVLNLERGQDGTVARPWPMNSCIEWQMVGAAVSALAFQAACCPAECIAPSISGGATFPDGVAGVAYSHTVELSGTPPITINSISVPSWMEATLDAGVIRFTGTPPAAGAYMVDFSLKGCGMIVDGLHACIYVTASEAAESETPT
jgi:hypothetical protein